MKTIEFVAQLSNPVLAQKMSTVMSPHDAYELAKSSGVTDSFEDFVAEMEKLKAAVGELSENDLASVAGGTDVQEQITLSVTMVVSQTAAIVAISAAV